MFFVLFLQSKNIEKTQKIKEKTKKKKEKTKKKATLPYGRNVIGS